jgi:hypothetical protein
MDVNGPIVIPLYDFRIIIYNNEPSINISFSHIRTHMYSSIFYSVAYSRHFSRYNQIGSRLDWHIALGKLAVIVVL